jgi:acetolactate synthase-1/2/3 large subunit
MTYVFCKVHFHHTQFANLNIISIIIYIFLFKPYCIIKIKVFTMRGGEAIIESLKNMGVKTIFGYPGGQTIPFYDMLYDADIDHILVRHEQCAAHAADGYARASGRVGVCLATSGPGATNLVTGIGTAYMDSSPIVAITGQVPTHLIGNDAFQEADIIGITMPIVKHSYQPKDPDLIPSMIKSSFEIASSGRPGPVLIDVPKEVQEGELTEFKDDLIQTPGYNPTVKGNIRQIKKARDLIKQAKKPMILAGAGVIISNACCELKKLAETINAPVMTSLLGKGAFDETNDLALGMLGMHGKKVSNDYINESDLLIAIGVRFSDRTTGRLDSFVPDTKVIHIDIDPAEIGKNVDVDLPIVGDARNILTSLNKVLNGYVPSDEVNKWTDMIKVKKQELRPRVSYDDIPLKPQTVIKEISEALTPESILTTDVGQNQMWAAHFFDTQKPRKFISSGGLGTMGFGFPAAIGAKVACPEDPVVSLNGDGGFLMVCQELATVREYDLPVIAIVLENRTLGMVYQWQSLLYNRRHSQTLLGSSPDFVKLAESFGVNGVRITKPGETKEALSSAVKDNEPILLNVVIDSEEALPMLPPGAGINEMIGEYKLEKDVI